MLKKLFLRCFFVLFTNFLPLNLFASEANGNFGKIAIGFVFVAVFGAAIRYSSPEHQHDIFSKLNVVRYNILSSIELLEKNNIRYCAIKKSRLKNIIISKNMTYYDSKFILDMQKNIDESLKQLGYRYEGESFKNKCIYAIKMKMHFCEQRIKSYVLNIVSGKI